MSRQAWAILLATAFLASTPPSVAAESAREMPLAASAFQRICVPILEQGQALDTISETLALPQTGAREQSYFVTMRWFWPDQAHPGMDPAPSIHANAESYEDGTPQSCTLIYDVHETPITREQAAADFGTWVATQPQFTPVRSKSAGLTAWQHKETGLHLRVSASYMEGGVVISYSPQ